MSAYRLNMPLGYAGGISRSLHDVVETHIASGSFNFGDAVKLDANAKAAKATGSDAVYGFAVRPFPTQVESFSAGDQVSVMRQGYMVVQLDANSDNAAKGGTVYLTSTGTFSATSTSNTAITGATFTMAAAAGDMVEIAYRV